MPIELTGVIQHDKVTVSPNKVGAGPVLITISNQTTDAHTVTLEGEDVTDRIRDEDVTHTSSIISTIPAVRRAMVKRQRELGQSGAIMNGRDIGTVVFPDATVKVFLTADLKERAGK